MNAEVRKARKRPVEIEYMVWPGGAENATPIIDWVLANGGIATWVGDNPGNPDCERAGDGHGVWRYCPSCDFANVDHEYIGIRTLEGVMEALPGDSVIRGVKGEFYPCKPDIFKQTYDLVLEES